MAVKSESEADFSVRFSRPGEKIGAGIDWAYALVARFATVEDGVTLSQLKLIWKGDQTEHRLFVSSETRAVFAALWGPPSGGAVEPMAQEEILPAAWKNPSAYALIPFEQIEPRWKVLRVDGFSPLDKRVNARAYPLNVRIQVAANNGAADIERRVLLPASNRESEKLISLSMTGVTALVRGTARMMNERGVLFPASSVGEVLAESDLTHISNEVSFNQDCSPERAASPEMVFCSAPDYIDLLEAVGTDIVELTGNHNLDKGVDAYRYTLTQYQQRGWAVFGGGLNDQAAREALLVDRGATHLAFLGCNWAGPDFAWASATHPGAAQCDMVWIESEADRLSQIGYLPIVTFQAYETDDYMPAPMQQPTDFSQAAISGAVIVSGSQSHFPQGFKFEGSHFVHYGLGNLFFDQMEPPATRKAFIDRHIFYGDQYLGVELVTIKLEDASRPRLLTDEERSVFLRRIFNESFGTDGEIILEQ
jgi:poly-gamma-glutamate synthesis protein (capsule biosynthesis protein)